MRTREPLEGKRRHKLLTKEIREALPALGSTDGDGADATAHLKLFCSFGRYTLYVTEFDGEDTFYGYCVSALGPDCDEWGYSSYRELAETTIYGGVPAIERDCFWRTRTVAEALADSGVTA